MRNIFFIGIGLFVIMLSACRSTRQVVQQTTSDSTMVSFREVDKVIHLPGDTVKVSMQAQLKDNQDTKDNQDFVPQKQTIETDRTKVTVELTKSGEIKATAITKDVDKKVIVLEKTVTTSKTSNTVVEQKESWFQRTLKAVKKSFNTILIIAFIVVFLYVIIRFKGRILNIFK